MLLTPNGLFRWTNSTSFEFFFSKFHRNSTAVGWLTFRQLYIRSVRAYDGTMHGRIAVMSTPIEVMVMESGPVEWTLSYVRTLRDLLMRWSASWRGANCDVEKPARFLFLWEGIGEEKRSAMWKSTPPFRFYSFRIDIQTWNRGSRVIQRKTTLADPVIQTSRTIKLLYLTEVDPILPVKLCDRSMDEEVYGDENFFHYIWQMVQMSVRDSSQTFWPLVLFFPKKMKQLSISCIYKGSSDM